MHGQQNIKICRLTWSNWLIRTGSFIYFTSNRLQN